jgi:hypothetical protein
MFKLVAAESACLCRGWAPGTAPPVAVEQLLVTSSDVVVRAQYPFSHLIFGDPILIGAAIAGAIAIPIAVANSKSESPSGS